MLHKLAPQLEISWSTRHSRETDSSTVRGNSSLQLEIWRILVRGLPQLQSSTYHTTENTYRPLESHDTHPRRDDGGCPRAHEHGSHQTPQRDP